MMLKSDTSSRDFSGNRHTYERIRQLRAELESLARGYLNIAGCKFSHTTTLRFDALQSNEKRSLAAYGTLVHQPYHRHEISTT